jgi:hypothetical protein
MFHRAERVAESEDSLEILVSPQKLSSPRDPAEFTWFCITMYVHAASFHSSPCHVRWVWPPIDCTWPAEKGPPVQSWHCGCTVANQPCQAVAQTGAHSNVRHTSRTPSSYRTISCEWRVGATRICTACGKGRARAILGAAGTFKRCKDPFVCWTKYEVCSIESIIDCS